MLADTNQLDRWRQLLGVQAEPAATSTDALLTTLRAATGRRFLLAAIDAVNRFDGVMDELRRTPASETEIRSLRPDPSNATRFLEAVATGLPDNPGVGRFTRQPAARGMDVASWVWLAYVQSLYGTGDGSLMLPLFISSLGPTALVFMPEDNPEPWWQAEMVILHALHSFALRSGKHGLVEKTLACADFHLREIQPDHATNEPWAIHAYASHHDGNVTAETLWHAAYIQHGGEPGPVARLLAREASTSLATWLSR